MIFQHTQKLPYWGKYEISILQLLSHYTLTLPIRISYKPYSLDEYTIHDCLVLQGYFNKNKSTNIKIV